MGKKKASKANNKNVVKYNTANISHNKQIDIFFILILTAFMIIAPFYRGLFFRENYMVSISIVGIIFTIYIIYKLLIKSPILLNTYMDVVFLCIPIIYLISFFFAVNAKDAFDQFLIYSAYFIIYKISSSIVETDNKYVRYFINGIILSIFILSLSGILDIMGVIELNSSFVGKRYYGLYQYPNTTASVLGVGIILTINTIVNESNTKTIPIYQMILTSIIALFIFTLSRGAFLVVAFIMLFNFLVLDARKKIKYILSIFITFISSSYLIYKFYTLLEEDIIQIGKLYIIALIISGLISFLCYRLIKFIKIKLSDKIVNISLILIITIIAGLAVLLFSIKEPIEYKIEHGPDDKASWKNTSIYLHDLEKEKEYTVEFDVMSSKHNKYSYGIIIWSYNENGERSELLRIFEPVGTDFTNKKFDFKTLNDTKKVRFLLYNYEPDSYTIYKNVKISDANGTYLKKMERLKYIPRIIANRIKDINFDTKNASTRIVFAKDGLKIIKDYPLLGAGGGAWKNLYRIYQSVPYNSTETHNYFVQYGTEVGIIGLTALAVLLVIFLYNMYKSIKDKSQFTLIYIVVISLLFHSAIDFNLSLVAVGYLLWMLMGVINGDEKIHRIENKNLSKATYIVYALAIIITISSLSINYGIKTGGLAAKTISEEKNTDKAIELYEKAIKYDRFNAVYRHDLAQIMNNKLRKTKDSKYYTAFIDQVEMIRKYEPHNHKYTPTICSMYLAIGKFEEASALADRRLADAPMLEGSYTMKIDINYEIANYYLKDEKLEKALPYLTKILKTEEQLNKLNEKLEKPIELDEEYGNKINGAERVLKMIKEELNI